MIGIYPYHKKKGAKNNTINLNYGNTYFLLFFDGNT